MTWESCNVNDCKLQYVTPMKSKDSNESGSSKECYVDLHYFALPPALTVIELCNDFPLLLTIFIIIVK